MNEARTVSSMDNRTQGGFQNKFKGRILATFAAILTLGVAGCATTNTTSDTGATARSAAPGGGQGTFDSRCYFAMKAIEASASAMQFQQEAQNSPFTVCTPGADGKTLSVFFFDPARRGGSTLYTLSLPDMNVLSATPQR